VVNYRGINHLALVTGDMTATIRFWRDLLGMRLVAGLGRAGYRQYFFEISPQTLLLFFEWPDAQPMVEKDHGVPVKGPAAFDHVAVAVASDEDLWALKDRLEAAGVWVSELVDHGFIHSIYSFDPNNIPIEFSALVAGVDLGRNPRMKDRNPLPAATEGPDPRVGHWPEPCRPTPMSERTLYPGEGTILTRDEPTPEPQDGVVKGSGIEMEAMNIVLKPIGHVQSDTPDDAIPRHWSISDVEGTLDILPEFQNGLKDIRPGQKIVVLFHFDRSPAFTDDLLTQTPYHRKQVKGVFSICSPRRPNPIGLSILEVVAAEDRKIRVRGVDMYNGTPILDIKPHVLDPEC